METLLLHKGFMNGKFKGISDVEKKELDKWETWSRLIISETSRASEIDVMEGPRYCYFMGSMDVCGITVEVYQRYSTSNGGSGVVALRISDREKRLNYVHTSHGCEKSHKYGITKCIETFIVTVSSAVDAEHLQAILALAT